MNRRMTVSGPRGRVRSIAGVALGAVLGVWAHASALAADVPVLLNEIMANNRSFTNNAGVAPDWVELFNPSSAPFDLADMSLSDSVAAPTRWVFPAGTLIPAGGYLTLECDGANPPSTTNIGFGLKSEGDTLYLFEAPARGGRLVDSVVFGLQIADLTIGRVGASRLWTLTTPTPRASNRALALGDPALVRINEWMAKPASGSDWFEVYNPQNQPVALGGLSFSDVLMNPFESPVRALSFLGTGSDAYQVFLADRVMTAGANHVNLKLSAGGDSILLFTSTATAIDAVIFGPQTQGVSEGRLPDGSTNIAPFAATPSPGKRNHLPVMNVVVNEVVTHTDPPLEDAIEPGRFALLPVEIWCDRPAAHLRPVPRTLE